MNWNFSRQSKPAMELGMELCNIGKKLCPNLDVTSRYIGFA
jgi:hypothetical protein